MTPMQRLLPLQNAQFGSKIEVAKNMRKVKGYGREKWLRLGHFGG